MSLVDTDKPVLNFETFSMVENEIAAGIPEIMLDLLETYLDDSFTTIQQLSESIRTGQYATVERQAHSLKSTAATFGAEKSASYFSVMEKLAREGDYDKLSEIIDGAIAAYTETREVVEVEKQRIEASL